MDQDDEIFSSQRWWNIFESKMMKYFCNPNVEIFLGKNDKIFLGQKGWNIFMAKLMEYFWDQINEIFLGAFLGANTKPVTLTWFIQHLCLGSENHTQYLWSALTLIILFYINFPHSSDMIWFTQWAVHLLVYIKLMQHQSHHT